MLLAELLEPEPVNWGLRGDPYLWRALAERFQSVELPGSAEEFCDLLHDAYRALTGQPLEVATPVFVAAFAHGGMSSGHVSPEFWREQAIPLLVRRFEQCRGAVNDRRSPRDDD